MSTFKEQITDQIRWYNTYYPSFDIDMIHKLMLEEIQKVLEYNLQQPEDAVRNQYISSIQAYLKFQQTLSTRERIALYSLLGVDGLFDDL